MLGWSNGGSAVLAAVRAGRHVPFARAVAFYPGCRAALEQGWRTRTPLPVLVGDADDWTGAEPCRALAEDARGRGEPVEITVYPGAYHDFDAPGPAVRERRGLAYTVNRDGVAHAGTGRRGPTRWRASRPSSPCDSFSAAGPSSAGPTTSAGSPPARRAPHR
ncbi:dienelactone hydrolase family protein [Methylobacterium sp. Gmos1]